MPIRFWDRTLGKLGFTRRRRRQTLARVEPRIMQFESLEPLQMLSADFGEVGLVSFSQPDAETWQIVELAGEYLQPVVIAGGLSYGGSDPATVRLRNVSSASFEVQIDEWNYLDASHTAETVNYVVIEAGTHVLPDGTTFEAGLLETDDQWVSQSLTANFGMAPLVLTQTQTYGGSDAVVTRQRNVLSTGFDVRLQEEENLGSHAIETVGYLVVTPGQTTEPGLVMEAGKTGDEVTHNWLSIPFGAAFSAPPVFIAAMQTTDGGDTANVRYRNLASADVEVQVDEEQSKDSEVSHTAEIVGYLAFNTSGILAIPDPVNQAPTATGTTQWHEYTEGVPVVDLQAIVVDDVDPDEQVTATLTLANTTAGTLTAGTGSGETYTPGTGIWTVTGGLSAVNAALAAVNFHPAGDNDLDTTIAVHIADGGEDGAGPVTGTITLIAEPVNDAPILDAIGNMSVDEHAPLTFTVTASDPIDHPPHNLTLSAEGLPAGATFDTVTGVFDWTPGESQQGMHDLTFTVTDDGPGNLTDSET